MRTVTEAPGAFCPFPFTLVRRGPNWIQRLEVLVGSGSLVTRGAVK